MIAVIGAACRFPGGIDSLDSLWSFLADGRDAVSEVPPDRWDQSELLGLPAEAAGRMRWGCFLDGDVYAYEPGFFGITTQEAPWVDPQHRLLLELAWEACEHSGIAPCSLAGSLTGTFFGLYAKDYLLRVQRPLERSEPYAMYTGFHSVAAGRLAFLLDLRGPQITTEAQCSSSLVAIHLACESLRSGESDLALAGGVLLQLGPEMVVMPAMWSMFSPTGRCHAFDARADGYVRGEGGGVVVLKRLPDAVRDGDRVLAVIRGSAVNQNGRGSRLSAPSARAQEALFRTALRRARIDPADVGLIETHGPGTAVGDPTEFASTAAVYGRGRGRCALGSIKTNIGHTESAAGIAGLLKAIACLRHGRIPPNLHFERWNPQIAADGTRLFVPTALSDWPVDGPSRLAAVSSFGISGSNGHVLLEQPPARTERSGTFQRAVHSVLLSGGTEHATRLAAARLTDWLDGPGAGTSLADVAHTLAARRSHGPHRTAILAATRPELLARLREHAGGRACAEVVSGLARAEPAGGTVWVFSGHGGQWPGMGNGLLDADASFTEVIDQLEPVVAAEAGFSLRGVLSSPEPMTGFDRVQPAVFAVQLGLAAMWRAHGVEPAAVIGHSMGEVAAAVVAGGLSRADGARVICRRSRLILRTAGQGLMATVAMGREQTERDLANMDVRDVSVAIAAAPGTTVVAGPAGQVRAAVETWERRDVPARLIDVDVASHTSQMDPILADLRTALADLTPRPVELRFYSTVPADPRAPVRHDGAYWAANLREVVKLEQAVRAAADDGHRVFVEIGPHPVLAQAMNDTLASRGDTLVAASLSRDQDERISFATQVAALHCAGLAIGWAAVERGEPADVPATTWDRRRFVADPPPLRRPPAGHPLAGVEVSDPDGSGRRLWQGKPGPQELPWLSDHRVDGVPVLPGAAFGEMALAAAAGFFSEPPQRVEVRQLRFDRLTPLDSAGTLTASVVPLSGVEARWELTARTDGSEPIKAAAGRLRHVPHGTPPPAAEVERLWAAHPVSVQPDEIYRAFGETGVEHGPAFRAVQAIGLSDDARSAAARLSLPGQARPGRGRLHLHPVLLDGCLQVVTAAWLRALGGPGGQVLPTGIDCLRVHGDTSRAAHCQATIEEAGQASVTARLRLLAADGTVLAEAEGVRAVLLTASGSGVRDERFLGQRWTPAAVPPAGAQAAGGWLVITETPDDAFAAELARLLGGEHSPVETAVVPLDQPGDALDAFGAVPARLRGIVVAPPADDSAPPDVTAATGGTTSPPAGGTRQQSASPPAGGTRQQASSAQARLAERRVGRLLRLAQRLAASGHGDHGRLWVITRAGQSVHAGDPVNLDQAGARGLLRVIGYEHPDLHPGLVDIDARTTPADLARELSSCPQDDDEIAYRRGERLAARLVPAPLGEADRRRRAVDTSVQGAGLAVARPGDLGTLELVDRPRRAPGPTEVEIQVRACGINFADLLYLMGVYSAYSSEDSAMPGPGFDCAGVVTAVGRDVRRLRPGQKVAAVAGWSFSSFVTTRADWTLPLPDEANLPAAAAHPLAYLTSWYALTHLAAVRPGEHVLIHSATGGTGLAAINIATSRGAHVLATAGTERKRALLRDLGVGTVMDSRTLDFAGQARAATGGRGVDVVLNSLTGTAQAAGLEALACRGRFIELGKRDIHQGTRLGLEPFRRNITLSSVDMQLLYHQDPGLIATLIEEIGEAVRHGGLPPLPFTAYPVAEAGQALRAMAGAEHTGKLVLTWPSPAPANVVVRPRDHAPVRPDGSYIVTGGLGGLGMLVTRWLAVSGAARVVLCGRSAPDDRTRAIIDDLRTGGTRIEVVHGDVAEQGIAERLVTAATADGGRLRGVVHAAAVVEDATIVRLDADLLERVWRPKVLGALRLHEATRDADLDWWVAFSSVAALHGSPGQGAYAAANAWLDEFVSWRRAKSGTGTLIHWGPWAEHGRGQVLADRGYPLITPQEGIAALDRILRHDPVRTGYSSVPLGRWLAPYPRTARAAFFTGMITAASPGTDGDDLLAALHHTADERERRTLAEECVRRHAATVLRLPAGRIDPAAPLAGLGLDSLLALELRNRLQQDVRRSIPATAIWTHPSIEALARYLLRHLAPAGGEDDGQGDGEAAAATSLAAGAHAALRQGGAAAVRTFLHAAARERARSDEPGRLAVDPVRLRPGTGGAVALVFLTSIMASAGPQDHARLAARLPSEHPVWALPNPGFTPGTDLPAHLDDLVHAHARAVRRCAGEAPFVLLGHSSAGWLAHAVSSRLLQTRCAPAGLALLDTVAPGRFLRNFLDALATTLLHRRPPPDDAGLTAMAAYDLLFQSWTPAPLDGVPTLLLRAADGPSAGQGPDGSQVWAATYESVTVPGDHVSMVAGDAGTTVPPLEDWLRRVGAECRSRA
ncbi:type I polyketide synthase [Nonomuraea sp. PA05]|uniref:type I polyketide synthase n=1 Tax=Nonomuraea sp. PA05 TaxID=2604466 RepID=UPI001651C6C8|nr:type I polyketide synthase [Nonomuraea sp. PA05]